MAVMGKSIHTLIRVIGVGNIYRGDDAVGILAARQLAEMRLPGVEVIERSGEGTALMDALVGWENIYLIDAMQTGAPPGEILRFEAQDEALPTQFSATSTHAFGVAEAIEMTRLLGELPSKLVVYGVEGQNYAAGNSITPEVEAALQVLISKISQELKSE